MRAFPFHKQHDSMQCGITCLQMICEFYGKVYSLDTLSRYCFVTTEGMSFLGISEAAGKLGLHTSCGKFTVEQLYKVPLPCILHWEQNHFVILYQIKGRKFYVADPGRELLTCDEDEFRMSWITTRSKGEDKGVLMTLRPTPAFYERKEALRKEGRAFRFLFGYIKQYRHYFGQIILGLLVGCLLQLIFPFLTQAIVDIGITHQNIGFIYLVLLAQLMLTFSQTAVDFIRRWILLHISMRINISLVSDFFIKLLKLPMSFFDTKLTGDLIQRMNDHERVEKFLTTKVLTVMFSLLTFIVFSCVLLIYSSLVFCVFLFGSLMYGGWLAFFLKKRKRLDYMLFEKQTMNNSSFGFRLTS